MLEKITDDELDFILGMHDPICAAECLFSDFENLKSHDDREDRLGHYRLPQLSMASYEYLLDEDPNLSKKENFQLRVGAGTVYAFGGRKFGKTHCVESIDMAVSSMLLDNEEVAFSSYDALHIRGILDKLIDLFETHFILKFFYKGSAKAPNYRVETKTGYTIDGVNQNIQSKNPGSQWFQKHVKRIYLEEASFETEEVYKKRLDAVSEFGAVIRSAGMTNFTKVSPAGRIFYSLENKDCLSNYPQYVSCEWDDKKKAQAIKEHGGEQSVSYRMFVKGEIVEDGLSVIDMTRVRKNYLEDKEIKFFEITKDNFKEYFDLLIFDKPAGVEEVHIHADIGETAPTEIVIMFKMGEIYRFAYNVTLYGLTDDEQKDIFIFIAGFFKATTIGLDTTEGTGRAIYRALEKYYGKSDNLVWCNFAEKLVVDFERDKDTGKVILDEKTGKPVEKEEYVSEWSIKVLKDLLYDNVLRMPLYHKLDIQLNSIVSTKTAQRVVYECLAEEDHILSAFRVFAIGYWLIKFKSLRPLSVKKFCKVGAGATTESEA